MQVHLKVYGIIRSITGELPESLDISGHTIADLINLLATKYGQKIKDELLDEKGDLDFAYAFFIKGERKTDIHTSIQEGDKIVITNILGGGNK
ncbi:MAG: hypothetical protein Q7R34_04310 [Dehalococcoidia bacterium]|nr:hypothetical protein [Dehalococcoidia bacterium]